METSGGIVNNIPGYFGASSVSIPIQEVYEAMQKGVMEAVMTPISSAPEYHLNEVTKYVLAGVNFGASAQVYAMNTDKWNSLPEDVQKAFIQAGKETSASIEKIMDEKVQEAIKVFEESGSEVIIATPEQNKEFLKIMAPMNEKWLEELKTKGINGEETLKEYMSIAENLK